MGTFIVCSVFVLGIIGAAWLSDKMPPYFWERM